MNYLLKRQPSPCRIVECILNNTKHSSTMYCFCGSCLRHHPAFRNNVPECKSSTYVSALKLQIDKKRHLKKAENEIKRTQQRDPAKKLTDMLKIMPPKASAKKMLNYKRKLLEYNGNSKTLGWRSRYNIDCTKSYDPNMLISYLEVEGFSNPEAINAQNIQENSNSNDAENIENKDLIYRGYNKVNSSLPEGQLKENEMRALRVISIPQTPAVNYEIEEPEMPVTEEEGNKEEAVEPLESTEAKQESTTLAMDFEKFTVSITREYSVLMFLHSSLDICITNGSIKEGFELFQSYRHKPTWKNIIKHNYRIIPDIYNALLYALSSKGYWYIMKTVTEWMEADRIKLNCESFAALLHCLAKIKESGNEDFVFREAIKLLNSIFISNVSLNDIFHKATLTKEATEQILAVIRQVVPSFEIQPDIMELSSDCALLKNLHAGPSNLQPQIEGLGAQELENLVEEQLLMERNFYIDVKAVSRGRVDEVPFDSKEKLQNLKRQWRASLSSALNSLRRIQKEEFIKSRESFNLHLYLNSLPVNKIVDILMETTQTMVEYSGGYSPSCDQFYRMLGHKVFQCYQLRKKDVTGFTDKTEKLFKKYVAWYINPSGPAMNSRQKWQMVIQDSERSYQLDTHVVKWPEEVLIKLGKLFLSLILREVKFTLRTNSGVMTLPVLYTMLRYRDNAFREEIKCHPIVSEVIDSVGFDVLHFRCEEIPMLCPPKPWKSPEHGGYLFLPTDFVRKPVGVQGKTVRLNDVPVQQLYASFDSLNALQSVPWMINEDVLDVALEVFKSGGSEKLAVPAFPEKPPPREKWNEELSYEERRNLYKKRNELVKNLANNYSLWCEALYRLSLANHFRKRVFWMPQNCDFRGRVYPVPPLLNHLGSDLFRSLLIFAKGKPLGPKGLDWLKIHLINLTGTHKRKSVKERLDYANEILPEIIDSAENPLTGNKWWTESDEPWQTLASCMELKKVLASPNPEAYICRFPIHQDGSCNGLQHYAALGKDLIGAESVNLAPSEKPQDVYSVVAAMIEQERAKDAAGGVEIAKILDGFVERKVVKQTVMTTVYGVTSYGAKLQIAKRLEEIPNFPPEEVNAAALYLTEKTFFCLKKMFTSAKQIQEWFINCATEICNRKDYVQWMSPLGLPVVQSYAKCRINPQLKQRVITPDILKQKNAFPPNFIHSLDSCHMMLTSLYCEQVGLTFAAVHDCFWTHPNTVDTMNRICREQFISLHSQPILEDLSQFFKKTYAGSGISDETMKVFESVPEKGDFDLKEVMNSVYFFS